MKTSRCLFVISLLAAALLAAPSKQAAAPVETLAARKDIGDSVEEKKETIEVTQVSRIWRIQADADKTISVFFETVAIFPDGREVQLRTSSTTRPVDDAAAPLELIEKLARTWLAADVAAAQAAQPSTP